MAQARKKAESMGTTPAQTTQVAKPIVETSALETIRVLGRMLDDIELVRIMNGNRIGALERAQGDPLPHLLVIQERLAQAEHLAELELARAWRKHPLAPWAKGIKGCGEKLIARLICEIGDPAERPNVAKLWAYCGHGDPARAGQIPANATQVELFKRGRPNAKKATFKLAYQFMRTPGSPYRTLYEQERVRYAEKLHDKPCRRCGPSGKPAQPESPWSDGHKHAAALRKVGKEFLKDLWIADRQLQGLSVTPKRGKRGGKRAA